MFGRSAACRLNEETSRNSRVSDSHLSWGAVIDFVIVGTVVRVGWLFDLTCCVRCCLGAFRGAWRKASWSKTGVNLAIAIRAGDGRFLVLYWNHCSVLEN